MGSRPLGQETEALAAKFLDAIAEGLAATRTRLSGVEVVREEMLRADPFLAARWDSEATVAKRIDAELALAARLYAVHAEVSEDTAKPAPLDWSELSAKRVRAWVAVAREAGRL